MTISSPGSVVLADADGKHVAWNIDSENRLTRQENQNPPQNIRGRASVKWSFSRDETSLWVSDASSPRPARLVSQVLLAERAHP